MASLIYVPVLTTRIFPSLGSIGADKVMSIGVCAPDGRNDHLLRPDRAAPVHHEA